MMAILISWKRLPIFILYKNDRHLGINILQDGGYVFAVVNLMYISLSLHATLNAKGYTQKIEQNQSFVQLRGAGTAYFRVRFDIFKFLLCTFLT